MVPWVTWLGYLTGGGQWTGGGSPRVREPSLPALYNNSKRLCAQKLYEKTPELLLNLISIVSYTMGAALPVLLRAVHPSAILTLFIIAKCKKKLKFACLQKVKNSNKKPKSSPAGSLPRHLKSLSGPRLFREHECATGVDAIDTKHFIIIKLAMSIAYDELSSCS